MHPAPELREASPPRPFSQHSPWLCSRSQDEVTPPPPHPTHTTNFSALSLSTRPSFRPNGPPDAMSYSANNSQGWCCRGPKDLGNKWNRLALWTMQLRQVASQLWLFFLLLSERRILLSGVVAQWLIPSRHKIK